ncbi:hypothetical protein FGG08_006343 [Glutinoglossum americanum]|uniref:Exosome complex component RRP45 n=1 Tax=Glutinoglossum americanum TaxID=1670608 RepID=A0A9P8L0Z9_9PEZI|nr:hypothetical protein FGG08_006343 [Glutinoglossum americanum]
MPREPELSLNERSFVLQALQENIRIDGRSFDAFRGLELNFGDEYGVADVKLGKTRVIARISAEVTRPFPDRLFDGIFTITTELSPIASPAFEVGRQTDQEVILSRILEKAIRRSSALDTESLCIIAGQKCWNIRADVHLLDYDGGLTDASCIAVIAALQHFRRPDVSVEGENVTIHAMEERVPVPLSLLHHPICVTFSFFLGGGIVLVDATLQEEMLRNGELTIALNRHGEICQIAKLGGVAVEALTFLNCTNIALVKAQEISRFISKKLEEDLKEKNPSRLLVELSAENER